MDDNIEAECDEEIAQISQSSDSHNIEEIGPRPMSWDGQLSDDDDTEAASIDTEEVVIKEEADDDGDIELSSPSSPKSLSISEPSLSTTNTAILMDVQSQNQNSSDLPLQSQQLVQVKVENIDEKTSLIQQQLKNTCDQNLLAKQNVHLNNANNNNNISPPLRSSQQNQGSRSMQNQITIPNHPPPPLPASAPPTNNNSNSNANQHPVLSNSNSNNLNNNSGGTSINFPRIPPSPDSALGGWSTPSSTSNLSRHNSDADSQRSFSSSSNNTTPPSPSNSPLLSHNHRVVNKCDDFDGDQQEVLLSSNLTSQGISRQQLINSPCPICGDRISGFHYGIFSCESCKGFFKRTVQNRKNYVCLRGALCHVAISTRKKCPACRFEKCLRQGMKLEAIREDRTRGGRSTYSCSYALPQSSSLPQPDNNIIQNHSAPTWEIPTLLKEIVECESLWHLSSTAEDSGGGILVGDGGGGENKLNKSSQDYLQDLCSAADRRLYRLVKWCKSLPLFKHIQVEDQTKLLLNSWCELLLFSCCYRSIPMSVGHIRINERLTLKDGDANGNQCISRMIHFTDNLRRLKLDTVEYAALKVIILHSEVDDLAEGDKVRESQENLLQCLQAYTLARSPESPSKFGELLLKISEIQRICQVGKEMLTAKTDSDSNNSGFNLLFELLRGDH